MSTKRFKAPSIAPLQRIVAGRIRVLVVEPEQQLRTQMVEQLKDSGFETMEADSTVSALASLRQRWHDVLVLDMHEGNVAEASLGVLRAIARRKRKPAVLLLTDGGKVQPQVTALELGAVAYLDKGEPLAQLPQHVGEVWERRPV